jgi:hypothetical protein
MDLSNREVEQKPHAAFGRATSFHTAFLVFGSSGLGHSLAILVMWGRNAGYLRRWLCATSLIFNFSLFYLSEM